MLMIGLLAMVIMNFELVKMVACAERNLVLKFDVHFCFCSIHDIWLDLMEIEFRLCMSVVCWSR